MYGATLSERGRPDDALNWLTAAIAVLQELVDKGRGDVHWQLALGYMDRGLALLRLHRWDDSLSASQRAVELFGQNPTNDPRFQGWMGHALSNVAEARAALGDIAGSRLDWARGLELLRRLMDDGQGGNAIYLRKAVRASLGLFESDPEASAVVLATAIEETERALTGRHGAESLRIECQQSMEIILPVAAAIEGSTSHRGLLERLRRCGSG